MEAQNARNIKGDNFEEVPGRGLEINTWPLGTKVFIDGVERGETPVRFDNLRSGDYHIRLSREEHREREFNITLFNTSRLIISIEMEWLSGAVHVIVEKAPGSPESLPFNPEIRTRFANGSSRSSLLSQSNEVTWEHVPAGNHIIRAEAFGWEESSVSVLVEPDSTVTAHLVLQPAALKLANGTQSRRRFNPLNPNNLGQNEYRFNVSAQGAGAITILNSAGYVVYSKELGRFDSRHQEHTWDGKDSDGNYVPQGTYTVLIKAQRLPEFSTDDDEDEEETSIIKLETRINYSLNVFPLSLESGASGLVFSPMPRTLPALSYQLNASVLYNGTGFPFNIGMRFSPLDRLELATIFNINPYLESQTGWGVSGQVKFCFLQSDSVPLSLAAGVSYTWASENGERPLSHGKGVSLFIPFSLELNKLSIVLCPAVFWRGPEGLEPEVSLSSGFLYRRDFLSMGLSARYEFNFNENLYSRFLAGAEINIFPPPSNFIISLQSGIINQNEKITGYCGFGIGLIF